MARQVFISYNQREIANCMLASHAGFVLYFLLKMKADFKTGTVGKHPLSKTNCQKLAVELSRSQSQGKPAVTYDRKAIDRLLDHLQLLGLIVREPYNDENNLVLILPLSPINAPKEDDSTETSTNKGIQEKLPKQATTISSQSQDCIGFKPINDSSSVMINTVNSINTINTLSNGDFDSWEDEKTSLLNIEEIKNLMVSRETMLYPKSLTSLAIYKGWIKSCISKEQLIKAIETAEGELTLAQTPNDVDAIIKREMKTRPQEVFRLQL